MAINVAGSLVLGFVIRYATGWCCGSRSTCRSSSRSSRPRRERARVVMYRPGNARPSRQEMHRIEGLEPEDG